MAHGRLPAGGRDLVTDLGGGVGSIALAAAAVEAHPEVVDHHLRPLRGEAEGDLAPDASAGTGHDGHTVVEQAHGQRPVQTGGRFSAKALGPSLASSLEKTSPAISDSMR